MALTPSELTGLRIQAMDLATRQPGEPTEIIARAIAIFDFIRVAESGSDEIPQGTAAIASAAVDKATKPKDPKPKTETKAKPEQKPEAPVIKKDELKAKVVELAGKIGNDETVALLKKAGSKTGGVSGLDESQYPAAYAAIVAAIEEASSQSALD